MSTARWWNAAGAACLLALASGCAAPGAGDRFYVLDGALPPAAAAAGGRFAGSLGVGPVQIPESLDRPQIVTRAGPHRLELAEGHRWAADLDRQVARVMALQLGELLQGARVLRYPWDPALAPERQLLVDLLRLDVRPGAEARLAAQWALVAPRGAGALASGRVELREPVAGTGQEAAVAAVDRLVARLSTAVAEALRDAP
jgi:hypothetical protein